MSLAVDPVLYAVVAASFTLPKVVLYVLALWRVPVEHRANIVAALMSGNRTTPVRKHDP
jgi:hypothetical protein